MELEDLKGKTYYEMLGVDFDAPVERIKEVYHDLARVFHPDSNFYDEIVPDAKANGDQVQIFKVITAAYNTLIDPEKRAEYNKLISPMHSGRLRSWDEEEEDFFAKNEQAVKEASKAHKGPQRERKITTTFGREELMRENEFTDMNGERLSTFGDLQPVSQMINFRPARDKRTWMLISIGIGVGIAVLAAVVLTLLFLKR